MARKYAYKDFAEDFEECNFKEVVSDEEKEENNRLWSSPKEEIKEDDFFNGEPKEDIDRSAETFMDMILNLQKISNDPSTSNLDIEHKLMVVVAFSLQLKPYLEYLTKSKPYICRFIKYYASLSLKMHNHVGE